MNGRIDIGSYRSWPSTPSAANVASAPSVRPSYTPSARSRIARTSGSRSLVRPPKMIASIGTPAGSSKSPATLGTLARVVVKRLFGCS